MDILIFHNSFLPDYNGSSIRLYNLISRLDHKFSIITSQRQGIKTTVDRFSDNINVKRVSFQPPNKLHDFNLLKYNYSKHSLIENGLSESFDLIQTISMPLYMVAAKELCKISKKPLIIDFRVYESQFNLTSLYNYYLINVSKILDFSSHIITPTNALKKWVSTNLKVPDNKITMVNNGVDMTIFTPKKSYETKSEELRADMGIDGKVVMYAGYLDNINGLGDLIEIIPSIIKKTDVSFVFIGDGPEKNRIIKLSEEFPQVKFINTVPMDEIPSYYLLSDIFIIPRPSTLASELITPLKLLEVMAMGKPVLGSNVGGISEVVTDDFNGYLYKNGDFNSFYNKLVDVIELNNKSISKNAIRTIINNYNWEKSSLKLKNVYENISNY